MNDADCLKPEDQEKAVEIRIEDVIYRSDESPAVVLAIKRTCSLSGECKTGHVTLGHENTLRLYLETQDGVLPFAIMKETYLDIF